MFTFEFSYCSIISESLQSSSSHQSGTFFIALCKIIRSLSNRLLFEYLTWFCFFSLGLITHLFLGLVSRDLISRWSWLILALCSGCFSFILPAFMSVQEAFEHFTFVSPQQWQMLHSRPRISLRDWKCLDSQFNFSNSSLALATCTFKICTFSSISCR